MHPQILRDQALPAGAEKESTGKEVAFVHVCKFTCLALVPFGKKILPGTTPLLTLWGSYILKIRYSFTPKQNASDDYCTSRFKVL